MADGDGRKEQELEKRFHGIPSAGQPSMRISSLPSFGIHCIVADVDDFAPSESKPIIKMEVGHGRGKFNTRTAKITWRA